MGSWRRGINMSLLSVASSSVWIWGAPAPGAARTGPIPPRPACRCSVRSFSRPRSLSEAEARIPMRGFARLRSDCFREGSHGPCLLPVFASWSWSGSPQMSADGRRKPRRSCVRSPRVFAPSVRRAEPGLLPPTRRCGNEGAVRPRTGTESASRFPLLMGEAKH